MCPIFENSTACTMFNANFISWLGLRIGLGFLWKLMSVSGFRVGGMSYLLEVKLDSPSLRGGGSYFFTESLILAQDERWRRA